MYRRLGRTAEARASYEKALALTQTGTRAAIPARADSAVEITKDSSEADADIEMTRRKASF
jgi:predicted RNA polymerase sigma factor